MGMAGKSRGVGVLMNNEKQHQDAYDPDRVVRKDVTDLQIEFGKIQSDIKHLEKNTVTNVEFEKWKVEFANWKLETVKWVV